MKVLVINAGSSSLKYQVIDMATETKLCGGNAESITLSNGHFEHKVSASGKKYEVYQEIKNHAEALELVLKAITDPEHGVVKSLSEISAVGHRMLHAGMDFNDSVLIDDEVMAICEKNKVLGPLHMPVAIDCVKACQKLMPETPMVAVFDTTFHSTMPQYAYMYAVPYEDFKDLKIRKYGFHGTSHRYVSAKAVEYLGKENSKIITCHLGNGSSLSAVKDGKCIDTTMGLTPLAGVVMGTRCGDVDAAVVEFMAQSKGISLAEVMTVLNKKSGLKGIAGESDFRKITELVNSGDEKAKLAVDMFGYSITKYIGAFYAALGGLDCIVLTGGIGENSDLGRAAAMSGLECFGVEFDFERNDGLGHCDGIVEISKPTSKVKVLVIPTNEELVIARDAVRLSNIK